MLLIMNTTYQHTLFLLFTLLFSTLAFAQEDEEISFEPHVIFDKAMGARSVAVADIDGDEDMDVLSASAVDNSIRWYENLRDVDGNVAFTDYIIFSSAMEARSVAVADFDNDNDLDVVSASASDHTIRWYENKGKKVNEMDEEVVVFDDHIIYSSATGATAVAVADVNKDGKMDVLSSSFSDNSIRWYENKGRQVGEDGVERVVFDDHLIFGSATGARSVTTADINNDGYLDVLSVSYSLFGGSSTVRWYQNDGMQNFSPHLINDDAGFPQSVAIADIDGDNNIDVLSGTTDNSLRWYKNIESVENDGTRTFTEDVIFKRDSTLGSVTSVVAVDLDGDNDLDVLMSNSGDFVRWYENTEMDGSVEFIEHTVSTNIIDASSSVAIADIDDDGDIDVVSAGYGDATIRWHESNASTLNVAKVLPHTTALYPNPTSSEVYLNYATATKTTYGLFDMAGKHLATYTQSGTAHQLDVSSVSKGTYILKATSGLQVNYYRIVKE